LARRVPRARGRRGVGRRRGRGGAAGGRGRRAGRGAARRRRRPGGRRARAVRLLRPRAGGGPARGVGAGERPDRRGVRGGVPGGGAVGDDDDGAARDGGPEGGGRAGAVAARGGRTMTAPARHWYPEEADDWGELQARQAKVLPDLVRRLRDRSQLYAERLADTDPDGVDELARLQDLPFTTKDDLRVGQAQRVTGAILGRQQAVDTEQIEQV